MARPKGTYKLSVSYIAEFQFDWFRRLGFLQLSAVDLGNWLRLCEFMSNQDECLLDLNSVSVNKIVARHLEMSYEEFTAFIDRLIQINDDYLLYEAETGVVTNTPMQMTWEKVSAKRDGERNKKDAKGEKPVIPLAETGEKPVIPEHARAKQQSNRATEQHTHSNKRARGKTRAKRGKRKCVCVRYRAKDVQRCFSRSQQRRKSRRRNRRKK